MYTHFKKGKNCIKIVILHIPITKDEYRLPSASRHFWLRRTAAWATLAIYIFFQPLYIYIYIYIYVYIYNLLEQCKLCTFLALCIFVLRKNVTINCDFSPCKCKLLVFVIYTVCSLWGTKWNFVCDADFFFLKVVSSERW